MRPIRWFCRGEIRVAADAGKWAYSREIPPCRKTSNDTLRPRHRWPRCTETGAPPLVGECIVCRAGQPACVAAAVRDDRYANDADWRSPPGIFRDIPLDQPSNISNNKPNPHGMAGCNGQRDLPLTVREYPRKSRSGRRDARWMRAHSWENACAHRGRSAPLGDGGFFGMMTCRAADNHIPDDAQSDSRSIDSGVSGNPAWPDRRSLYGEVLLKIDDIATAWTHAALTTTTSGFGLQMISATLVFMALFGPSHSAYYPTLTAPGSTFQGHGAPTLVRALGL